MKACIQYGLCIAILAATQGPVKGQTASRRDSLSAALILANRPADRISILSELSKWHLGCDYPKAVAYADSALNVARLANDVALIALATTHRALVFWHNGDYDQSISHYLQALAIQEKLANDDQVASNHHGIGMNYYYMADYLVSLEHHEMALAGFTSTGNKAKQALVLNHIGGIYHKMGNYPKAIENLFKSSGIQQQLPGYDGEINSFIGSSAYHKLGDYWQRELAKHLIVLEKERAAGQRDKILSTLNNIASIYNELKDRQQYLEYCRQAVDYSISIGRMPDYAWLGTAYLGVGQVDSAIYFHKLELDYVKSKGTRIYYLNTLQLLGLDFFSAEQYEKSLEYYQSSLAVTSQMGNRQDVVQCLQKIARVYLAMNKPREAAAALIKSVDGAKDIGAQTLARDGLLKLASVYVALGDVERAYFAQKEGHVLADSITSGEAKLEFARLQVQYESDRKSDDIQRLGQERQIQEMTIRNKDLLIFAFLLAIVLGVLLAISGYRRYRLKIEANKILEQQKARIEMLLAEIHHRVKNNLQVISSLLSIQGDQLKNKKARMAVIEGQSRVQVMGLIHENIYQGTDFAFINLDSYLEKLVGTILNSFGFGGGRVDAQVNASGLSIDIDTAVPLGLIINELTTNSLKHAFRSIPNPTISIRIYQDGNCLNTEVTDNGCGMPDTLSGDSFGLQLVKELAQQLGGTVAFMKEHGCLVRVRISKFKLAA